MARKTKIDTDTLLSLVGQFYAEKCDNDASKLKIPAIGEYIRSLGYDVADYLIRRNQSVKDYISNLQSNSESFYISSVSVYRDIDIRAFLEKNNTPDKLMKAIKERENYYREVTNSASYSFQENKKMKLKISELEKRIGELESAYKDYQGKSKEISLKYKELKEENKSLRDIVDTYVYPEIANELLKKQGLLKNTAEMVSMDKIEETIISSDTDVQNIKSNVIKGLFNKV